MTEKRQTRVAVTVVVSSGSSAKERIVGLRPVLTFINNVSMTVDPVCNVRPKFSGGGMAASLRRSS